jgi:hypothetical protein
VVDLASREQARFVDDPKLSALLFDLCVFKQARDSARENASFRQRLDAAAGRSEAADAIATFLRKLADGANGGGFGRSGAAVDGAQPIAGGERRPGGECLIGGKAAPRRPAFYFIGVSNRLRRAFSFVHERDVLAFECCHLRRCKRSNRVPMARRDLDQPALFAMVLDGVADAIQNGSAHGVLKSKRLQLAPIGPGVSLDSVRRRVAHGLVQFVGIDLGREGRTAHREGGDALNLNPIGRRSLTPLFLERLLVALILGKPRAMGGNLGRGRTVHPKLRQLLFDLLAAEREGHYLLTPVTFELPPSIFRPDIDRVAERLDFAREFGAVDGGGERLRAVDFDRIEAAPRAVGTPRHIHNDNVRVQMWIRAVAIIRCVLGRAGGDVIEPRGDDIARGNPLLAASNARLGETFQLLKRSCDRSPMRRDKARVVPCQGLHAH